MEQLIFSSVENLPHARASAAFTEPKPVFKEDGEISPTILSDTHAYMPWGATNLMPFDIIDLIESDETLATCQMFNAEVCYGSGLQYDTAHASDAVAADVEDFLLDNDLASYFLGVCQDFKHFAFAVSVIILNTEGTKIVRLIRKEACYCRFAPADKHGRIPRLYFANWRKFATLDDCEIIEMLDTAAPFCDLRERLKSGCATRKFAIVSRVPTPDSTYYPIPYYAALFRGKWYNIKQLIGLAKEAKLKNSAPIKYHIEVSQKYWDSIFKSEGITDRARQQARIVEEKRRILDFLTGAENSGKVWFSTFYVNPNGDVQHDIVINKIDSDKEGGDWESDIQEAVNMICFYPARSLQPRRLRARQGADQQLRQRQARALHHRPGFAETVSRPPFHRPPHHLPLQRLERRKAHYSLYPVNYPRREQGRKDSNHITVERGKSRVERAQALRTLTPAFL